MKKDGIQTRNRKLSSKSKKKKNGFCISDMKPDMKGSFGFSTHGGNFNSMYPMYQSNMYSSTTASSYYPPVHMGGTGSMGGLGFTNGLSSTSPLGPSLGSSSLGLATGGLGSGSLSSGTLGSSSLSSGMLGSSTVGLGASNPMVS